MRISLDNFHIAANLGKIEIFLMVGEWPVSLLSKGILSSTVGLSLVSI